MQEPEHPFLSLYPCPNAIFHFQDMLQEPRHPPPPLVTSSLRLMVLTYLSRDPPDVLAAATPTTVPMEFYTKRVIDVATVRAS